MSPISCTLFISYKHTLFWAKPSKEIEITTNELTMMCLKYGQFFLFPFITMSNFSFLSSTPLSWRSLAGRCPAVDKRGSEVRVSRCYRRRSYRRMTPPVVPCLSLEVMPPEAPRTTPLLGDDWIDGWDDWLNGGDKQSDGGKERGNEREMNGERCRSRTRRWISSLLSYHHSTSKENRSLKMRQYVLNLYRQH